MKKIYAALDMRWNQIWNFVFQNSGTNPLTPRAGQAYYNQGLKQWLGWDGTQWVNISSQGVVVHNLLQGLSADDHSQYVHVSVPRAISTVHTFTNSELPFQVTSSGLVNNLNAYLLRGFLPSINWIAGSYLPITNAQGKLPLNSISEIMSGTDLADIDGYTGTGSVLAKQNQPQFTGNANFAGPVTFQDVLTVLNRIHGLSDPQQDDEPATKRYVDAHRIGITIKDPVRASTTTQVSLSVAPGIIDGVNLQQGDRILVKDQGFGAPHRDNGIYEFHGAGIALTRTGDADTTEEMQPGTSVWVNEGITNGDCRFVLTTDAPITLGVTDIKFTIDNTNSTSGANANSAGVGVFLDKNGNTLRFKGVSAAAGNRIGVQNQTQNNTVEVDVVEANLNLSNMGGVLPVNKGGTGASTQAQARANLGISGGKFTGVVPATGASVTITHSLNTLDIIVGVREISTGKLVAVEAIAASVNTVTLNFGQAPTTNQYQVIVLA
jgi:hypothetical protein